VALTAAASAVATIVLVAAAAAVEAALISRYSNANARRAVCGRRQAGWGRHYAAIAMQ